MFRNKLQGKHVLITGGSEGIGFAIAQQLLDKGAIVTLVARTKSKLEDAVSQLQGPSSMYGKRVTHQVADVTDPGQIQAAVDAAESTQGPIDIIVCNAGAAVPGYFHDQEVSLLQQNMELNYFGTVNTIKAVYDKMIRRAGGHICIISSVVGLMGFTGYTSYAPTKYALKGLADCLRNELLGTGVAISIAFPPDADTPGHAAENKTKPPETFAISGMSEVFPVDKVASWIVSGLAAKKYSIGGPDLGLNLHINVMQGIVSRGILSVLIAMPLGFIAPLIQAVYAWLFDRVARRGCQARFSKLLSRED